MNPEKSCQKEKCNQRPKDHVSVDFLHENLSEIWVFNHQLVETLRSMQANIYGKPMRWPTQEKYFFFLMWFKSISVGFIFLDLQYEIILNYIKNFQRFLKSVWLGFLFWDLHNKNIYIF